MPHSRHSFSPDQGWVEVDLPPSGQTWSYSLSAEVQNLYETVDPNHPYLLNTFVSQDICVTSEGAIDPNDGACPDLDQSRRLPPGSCETNCTPAGGGGPGSWEEAWQDVPMRMMPIKKLRGASLEIPAPHRPEAAPGEAGWRIARGRRIERGPGSTAADVAMNSSGAILGATSSVSTSDVALQIEPMRVGFADELRPLDPLAPITTIDAPVREGFPSRPEEAKRIFERVPPTAGPPGGAWPDRQERADSLFPFGVRSVMEAGGLNWVPPLLITGTSTKHFRWEFFSSDHLGSVRVVTDPSGAKVWETKYLPYGEEVADLAGSSSSNTHRFTGHERDAEGELDYLLARYYSPLLKRFVSADPDARLNVPPSLMNKFTYTGDNPMRFHDPDGKFPKELHADLISGWYGSGPASDAFATAVANVDWDLGLSALIHPDWHFGRIQFASKMLEQAIAAAKTGDFDGARRDLAISVHSAMDDAAHRDAEGQPIGWWKHLGLALIGKNPDNEHLDAKKEAAEAIVRKIVDAFEKFTGMTVGELFGERDVKEIESTIEKVHFDIVYAILTGKNKELSLGLGSKDLTYDQARENYRISESNSRAMDPSYTGFRAFHVIP